MRLTGCFWRSKQGCSSGAMACWRARGHKMHWTKLRGIVFLIAVIAIWEIASRSDLLNPLIMPAPARIFGVFSDLISSGQIPWQILVSMKRAAAGYFLAAGVFIPLGIVM